MSRQKGYKHSEVTKLKIGKTLKGYKHSEEHKEKIRQALLNRKFSEESIEKMRLAAIGENNHGWKGGKANNSNGYVMIYKPEHPFSTKENYVFEHRLVMEQFLGRFLTPAEVVHHINGIKTDNRIENLRLFASNSEHIKHHEFLKKVSLNE